MSGPSSSFVFWQPDSVDVTEEECHRARLAVCGVAKDVADARFLLRMLGLIEEEPVDA